MEPKPVAYVLQYYSFQNCVLKFAHYNIDKLEIYAEC